MSDKSVKKTLDWPTHDDHQDKPPEFGKWTSTTGPTWKRDDEGERCPTHKTWYYDHSQEELEQDIAAVNTRIAEHGEQDPEGVFVEPCPSCHGSGRNEVSGRPCGYCRGKGKIPKYEEQDPSQQLNPTEDQNQTPLGQGQFMPTSTVGYVNVGHSEGEGGEEGAISPEIEADLSIDVDCPSCGKTSYLGPLGFEQTLKEHQWVCPYCKHVEVIENEEDLDAFVFDVGEEENGFGPLEEEGPLTDPREREKEPEKEPGEGLSPEAQKITGTDPASRAAKQKEKPKLEVDVDQRITVLGKSGSGKTNLIKVLMANILPDYNFILLDSIGNFAEFNGKPNIEYHLVNPSDDEEVDKIIYSALEKGDCMVVIDEIDRYKSEKGSMVNELVNLGRNYGVGGIFAARRTADVNKDILANSPYIFTFQHILPQDLSVLIDWFAQDEAVFRDLQQFEAILFKDGEQIWVGKVPEMQTTAPTKKPPPPKKPKSKGPPTGEKGKQPPPAGGEGGEPEGEGKEPPTTDEGKEKQPEPVEKKPPELTPADEGEQMASQKSEARYADEAPFMCEVDGTRFKYESDFEDHMVREHAY